MQDMPDVKPGAAYRIYSAARSLFVYLLALAIIIAAAFFAADKSPNKSLFGFRYYTVLTDSMVPEFRSGDMVFVQMMSGEQIETGDIITFNPSSGSEAYLTHRVVEKLPDYQGTGVICFRTKGDANDSEDSFLIDEGRVIGKVRFHIPKMGFVLRFVQLRWYFIVPLVGLLILFFSLMKRYFALKNGEESAEEEISGHDKSHKEEEEVYHEQTN